MDREIPFAARGTAVRTGSACLRLSENGDILRDLRPLRCQPQSRERDNPAPLLLNGFPTWALSPINVFLDLISLPYINRGVYRLGDLPTAQREEVMRLIQAAKDVDLVGQLDERAKENERTMIFFQWYGVNVHTFLDVPAFHQPWKYIETIGVSIFNRRVSTSKHFGC